MPTFTLNTTFTQDALTMLYTTGTNVVVAKPGSGGSSPNVAWIAFRPLMANGMTWQEQYGIYCSTSNIQNGALLTQMSQAPFPAADGQKYPMNATGFFGPPQTGGMPGSYTASNQYNNLAPNGPGFLTFGLFQNASVNGNAMTGNAVSAAPVPYLSTAVMTPFTTIYLWTQSQVASNTVVTSVTSVQTEVTFGGSITTISMNFDPTTGGFVQTGASLVADANTGRLASHGGKALPAGISVTHHLPALG
ncbi:MAG TPA: hypothetical protein VOA87_04910 [Thermoanaerobaculia bacterium]|nr:hypothetical protein [Thermoanaerobaculia bacterium]